MPRQQPSGLRSLPPSPPPLEPSNLQRAWPRLSLQQQALATREALGRFAPLTPYYTPRPYQLGIWQALVLEQRRRNAWVMHRRGGKDLTVWNAFIWLAANWRVGTYYYSLPTQTQARKTIWRNMTNEGVRFLKCIPEQHLAKGLNGKPAINNSEMLVEFKNGSIIQLVGGDNYDSIVGSNPVAICFSEWSLTDPSALDYFRPMVTANDGLLAFLYTPRGHNHGKTTYDRYEALARRDPVRYFCELLTVKDTGAITEEDIQYDRDEGMSEARVQQEYYCDFDVANEGAYYGKLITAARRKGRIAEQPHDPALLVHTAWDIGVSDHTVIWFFQVRGNAVYIIDYYASHGEGLEHYIRVLDERRDEDGYRYGVHVAPHDVDQRSKNDAKSYRQYAKERGLKLTVLKQTKLESGIEAARVVLPRCFFDLTRCKRGIEALESYTKKWNEALKVWSDSPQHDWASHPADAFRYLALAVTQNLLEQTGSRFAAPSVELPGIMGRSR